MEAQLNPDLKQFETWCTYCGDFNECQDHVTCVAYNSGNRSLDRGPTVACCNMCNNLAGDFVAESVIQKAIHLEIMYERKFGRKLQSCGARWTRVEIAELTGNLRDYVECKQFLVVLLRAKLKNLNRVINGYLLEPIRGAYRRKEVIQMTKRYQQEYDKL